MIDPKRTLILSLEADFTKNHEKGFIK